MFESKNTSSKNIVSNKKITELDKEIGLISIGLLLIGFCFCLIKIYFY
jgi:hypothetical protein